MFAVTAFLIWRRNGYWRFSRSRGQLSGTSSPILVAVPAAVIFVGIRLGHKKARDISKQFLAEHPNAATLYLYGE